MVIAKESFTAHCTVVDCAMVQGWTDRLASRLQISMTKGEIIEMTENTVLNAVNF
jgi:hypothetical protein